MRLSVYGRERGMSVRELEATVVSSSGEAKVALSGWMDVNTSGKLRMTMLKLLQENWSSVVLDCERLEYIDSSGIGQLLFWRGKLQEQNRSIVIANAGGGVLQIFKMAGLNKVFEIR